MILLYGQKKCNIEVFRELLNELHSSLKFSVGKGKCNCEQNFGTFVQALNVLDVSIILHQKGWLETYIFYQEINLNLTKRIIVFVSDEAKTNEKLSELKMWLLLFSYLLAIIEIAFSTLNYRDLHLKRRNSCSVCISTI